MTPLQKDQATIAERAFSEFASMNVEVKTLSTTIDLSMDGLMPLLPWLEHGCSDQAPPWKAIVPDGKKTAHLQTYFWVLERQSPVETDATRQTRDNTNAD